MYLLQSDGVTVYRPFDTVTEKRKILSGILTQELNNPDKFEFIIPPTNLMGDYVKNLSSQITLFEDSKEVFRGRALEQNGDFYNRNKVLCKGFLDYFNDAVCRPAAINEMSARMFLSRLVDEYNSQVDEYKKVSLGNVTVDSLICLEYDYIGMYDLMFSKLIGSYGGYIKYRRSGNINYIDYVAESGVEVAGNEIKFGNNLLDIQKKLDAKEVCTVLVPYGENGVTVSSVNNGIDYIENLNGISVFGRICKPKKFDGITNPADLLKAATNDLNERISQALTLELTAIDLHHLNIDVRSMVVGNYYKVLSAPHGINDYYCCTKKITDIFNQQNSKVTFGYTRQTLTDLIKRKGI